MASKKLMTIEDLYNFCLKNNFSQFNSSNTDDEIVVQMPATFEESNSEDKHTQGLYPFVSKAFHDHVNLNKSEIKEDVFVENLPSAQARPVLANIVTLDNGLKDFHSHDFEERPIGVIQGEATVEYDEKAKVNRAILNGFIFGEYCPDAIEILERRGTVDCSVELTIREMSFNAKDNVLTLEDYYVSGLTLLGEGIKPGMAGSDFKIEDFSAKNNSIVETVDNQLIKTLNALNETLMGFNKETTRKEEDELNKEFDENVETEVDVENELFEAEVEAEAEVEVETENEEAEVEEETVEETPEVVEEKYNISYSHGDVNVQFEISHEDIRHALYTLIYKYEEEDNDCYFINDVYDNYFVMYSCWSNKYYKQNYVVENDNVSLDGERVELFCELLTASEKTVLDEMRSNYSSISEKLAKYESEPAKMEILNSDAYAKIVETEEFEALMSQEGHFDLSVEEVQNKADEILLSYAKKGTFELNTEVQSHTIVAPKKNKGKYGNLFHK